MFTMKISVQYPHSLFLVFVHPVCFLPLIQQVWLSGWPLVTFVLPCSHWKKVQSRIYRQDWKDRIIEGPQGDLNNVPRNEAIIYLPCCHDAQTWVSVVKLIQEKTEIPSNSKGGNRIGFFLECFDWTYILSKRKTYVGALLVCKEGCLFCCYCKALCFPPLKPHLP